MSAPFEIKEAAKLLDTSVLRLNKLMLRSGFGSRVEGGGQKGKRRHFSVQDLCRLGFALWLSRAGLRGPAVANALGRRAVRHLLGQLLTLREIRSEAERERFLVAVEYRGRAKGYRIAVVVGSLGRIQALRESSGVVVPIGALLESLAKRLTSFAKF